MSGNFQVPESPPGMPYIKAPPMGEVNLISPDGESLGKVAIKTAPPPPGPPPTVIKFGDVGVAPAGCPMCPVLDKEAVKEQKEKLKRNAHRIERLKHAEMINKARIQKSVDSMKKLKETMQDKLFSVKEAIKKEDSMLEMEMLQKENSTGPIGPKGATGYAGANGKNGHDGEDGIRGRQGRQGPEGPLGETGPRGKTGPQGVAGPQGPIGPRGPIGPAGPAGEAGPLGPPSVAIECERIGGQIFKGICFKSSELEGNADAFPEDCKPWQPHEAWNQADWWKLASMFRTQPMTPNIDRGSEGGRCSNFEAVASFTQDAVATKVWVNSKSFSFTPTGAGRSCDLSNGEGTIAVYACAV
mmetsp:Transcript_30044/g.47108  ORF Transcript_30044/g.47108 Transcript_30044/m.47108 type:complete len:356 (-) Transcript_30044:2506-3573(-)